MKVSESFHKKRVLYSIFVPPLLMVPVGVLLFLFVVDVSIIRHLWYLSIFLSCIYMAMRDKTPLSHIGLSKRKLGLSVLLAGAWEVVTFCLGIAQFFALTGKLPILAPLNESMMSSALHFTLVSLAEETWMRGLLLRRLREWKPKDSFAILCSSIIFVLFHVPAASQILLQNVNLLPLLALSWLTLFIWATGLAFIALKTENLFGPIVAHGVDNFVTKVLYPLQI